MRVKVQASQGAQYKSGNRFAKAVKIPKSTPLFLSFLVTRQACRSKGTSLADGFIKDNSSESAAGACASAHSGRRMSHKSDETHHNLALTSG